MERAKAAATVVLALAACRVDADYGGTGYRCGDGECPAGQVCVSGRCVEPGDVDAAAPPDAPEPADGAVDAGLPDAPSPDAAPPDAAPNLVANPGTEDGLTGWESFQGTLRTSSNMPHGGLAAIVGCKDPTGGPGFFSVYTDVINGAPGDVAYPARYVGSIWVRASFTMTETPPASLYLVLREGGGAAADVDHAGAVVMSITTTWVQLTTEAVIEQPDRDQLILIVWPGDVPDGTCFAIDDAYVARVE